MPQASTFGFVPIGHMAGTSLAGWMRLQNGLRPRGAYPILKAYTTWPNRPFGSSDYRVRQQRYII
jgi:hypothetical protein